jgi:hypothetical protein
MDHDGPNVRAGQGGVNLETAVGIEWPVCAVSV